jgi:hypothetical protein
MASRKDDGFGSQGFLTLGCCNFYAAYLVVFDQKGGATGMKVKLPAEFADGVPHVRDYRR